MSGSSGRLSCGQWRLRSSTQRPYESCATATGTGSCRGTAGRADARPSPSRSEDSTAGSPWSARREPAHRRSPTPALRPTWPSSTCASQRRLNPPLLGTPRSNAGPRLFMASSALGVSGGVHAVAAHCGDCSGSVEEHVGEEVAQRRAESSMTPAHPPPSRCDRRVSHRRGLPQAARPRGFGGGGTTKPPHPASPISAPSSASGCATGRSSRRMRTAKASTGWIRGRGTGRRCPAGRTGQCAAPDATRRERLEVLYRMWVVRRCDFVVDAAQPGDTAARLTPVLRRGHAQLLARSAVVREAVLGREKGRSALVACEGWSYAEERGTGTVGRAVVPRVCWRFRPAHRQ